MQASSLINKIKLRRSKIEEINKIKIKTMRINVLLLKKYNTTNYLEQLHMVRDLIGRINKKL